MEEKMPVSEQGQFLNLSSNQKLLDSTPDSCDIQDGLSKLKHTASSKYEESKSVTATSCRSKETDVISSSQDLGEKFDKCIERMEGSFVKAIQELSKTQNEIFGRAMNSIRDEISTSVIKQLKPTIQDEMKSLKADIRKEIISSFKDMQSDQKSNDETILREQIVELKANHNTEVMQLKEIYHQKMESQIEKHRNKIESVMENHETEARSLQTKYRREIDAVQEQHETEVKKLKHKMEAYESEILSLKLHSSRSSDLNEDSPGVQIVGSGRRDSTLSSYAMAASSNGASSGNRNDKPFVLLVGKSTTDGITLR